ncbi:MAG: hypothetical protein KGJ06_06145 [Pseudomonadota bacterium]|nr:hypothetical protein [Pseudomonadota bacterium]
MTEQGQNGQNPQLRNQDPNNRPLTPEEFRAALNSHSQNNAPQITNEAARQAFTNLVENHFNENTRQELRTALSGMSAPVAERFRITVGRRAATPLQRLTDLGEVERNTTNPSSKDRQNFDRTRQSISRELDTLAQETYDLGRSMRRIGNIEGMDGLISAQTPEEQRAASGTLATALSNRNQVSDAQLMELRALANGTSASAIAMVHRRVQWAADPANARTEISNITHPAQRQLLLTQLNMDSQRLQILMQQPAPQMPLAAPGQRREPSPQARERLTSDILYQLGTINAPGNTLFRQMFRSNLPALTAPIRLERERRSRPNPRTGMLDASDSPMIASADHNSIEPPELPRSPGSGVGSRSL